MTKPLKFTLTRLRDDLADLIQHSRNTTRHLVDRSPVKETVDKVHQFVLQHPDLMFWTSHAVNMALTPVAFSAGAITGIGLSLARRVGATDLDLAAVNNVWDKATFSYANLFALVLVGRILRGFSSGYIAGDYVGRFGSYEQAMQTYETLRQTLEEEMS